MVLPIGFMCIIACFFAYWLMLIITRSRRDCLVGAYYIPKHTPHFSCKRFKLEKRDIAPIIIITLVYALIAFLGLGEFTVPQSSYRFENESDSITIDLNEKYNIGSVRWYSGLHDGWFGIEFSEDGVEWTPKEYIEQGHGDLFKWLDMELYNSLYIYSARFVRISAWNVPLEINELALYNSANELIDSASFSFSTDSASSLFDEQELVAEQTYLNSMYFDEIYHGRTALEHIRGYEPYEISHPPLGKLILSIGIRIFGMVPFGWRFMGTLFGVLMLPILYIFIKNLFGKTLIASCGTIVFAFDFMHFVQTRIATIDTYGVFFIMLMYFFMYRYVTCGYEAPFSKTVLPLFLCGLSFGIGAACKWTSIYGAPGLLAIYIIYQIQRYLYYKHSNRIREFHAYLLKTLMASVAFFIIIPCAIYYLSYIPYGLANGQTIRGGMLWSKQYFKTVWDNQVFMLTYHSGVTEPHPYASRWYTWLLDIRPILYYLDYISDSVKSAFAAFGNPMLWWGGLFAILAMFIETILNRSGKALYILIGYFSSLIPWMIISRPVFIYHYFPCTVFLTLAPCHVFNTFVEKKGIIGRGLILIYTSLCILLFVMFYPVLTGIPFSRTYTFNLLRWFYYSWPF